VGTVQQTRRHALVATGLVLALAALVYLGASEPGETSNGRTHTVPERTYDSHLGEIKPAPSPHVAAPTYQPPRARRAYVIPASERSGVPEGNVAGVLAKLAPLAEAGDARAALEIYNKLSNCRAVIASGIAEDEMAAYRNAGIDEQTFLRGIEKNQENCIGSQEQIEARGKWLEQAAAAGSIEAQLVYLSDPDAIIGGGPSGAVKNPDKAREFKAKGLAYLEQLVASGNIDAMMHLSGVYDAGFVVERDPVRAYALNRVVDRAQPGMIPPELLQFGRAELSSKDLARAESLANQLYSSCCNGKYIQRDEAGERGFQRRQRLVHGSQLFIGEREGNKVLRHDGFQEIARIGRLNRHRPTTSFAVGEERVEGYGNSESGVKKSGCDGRKEKARRSGPSRRMSSQRGAPG